MKEERQTIKIAQTVLSKARMKEEYKKEKQWIHKERKKEKKKEEWNRKKKWKEKERINN